MRIHFPVSLTCCVALLLVSACDESTADPLLELDEAEADLDAEEEDDDRVGPAADGFGSQQQSPAFPGFGLDVAVAGDDVVLDWALSGPSGADVRVYRSADAHALTDADDLPNPDVDEVVLAAGATSFTDVGAATQAQPTTTEFYRVVVDGESSTLVMRRTTETAPGYNKLGMCMLGGPSNASDVAAQVGDSIRAVWTWDAANQSYVRWRPSEGVGTPEDFAIPFGSVVAAQVDGSAPASVTLVGTVPTDEAAAISAEPGYNWSLFPALYDGPLNAAYWVDVAGYLGMGTWTNTTQRRKWYRGPGRPDLEVAPCEPFYTDLSDDACTSNDDCNDDAYCDFEQAAACGDVAAGTCRTRPMGCDFAPQGEVCGCDGNTYATACDAELSGVALVDDQAGCPLPPTVYDAAADFQTSFAPVDEVVLADYTCSEGFSLITPDEARERNAELCSLIDTWDIVRLAGGGSMGGSGYGCPVFDEDARTLGASLCTSTGVQGHNGWHYLYDADGTSNYTEHSVGTTYWGDPGTWRDATCTESAFLQDGPDAPLIMVPPSVGACDGFTTLAWEAPDDGLVEIDLDAQLNRSDCSSYGVELEVHDEAGTVLWAQDAFQGVLYEHSATLTMQAGERVYLRAWQGPGGSWCDSVYVNMVVNQYAE